MVDGKTGTYTDREHFKDDEVMSLIFSNSNIKKMYHGKTNEYGGMHFADVELNNGSFSRINNFEPLFFSNNDIKTMMCCMQKIIEQRKIYSDLFFIKKISLDPVKVMFFERVTYKRSANMEEGRSFVMKKPYWFEKAE